MIPRILIAAPTSEKKNYCFLKWLSCVRQIDYPKDRMEVMLVDNSSTYEYVEHLRKLGITTRYVEKEGKTPIEYICESHNVVRDYFLKNKFDYLFHLESDVMVKTQTLRTLLFHSEEKGLPVVSASYFRYNDVDTTLLLQQNETDAIGIENTVRNIGFKECLHLLGADLLRVWGSGIGAILIRREVMEKVPFRFQAGDNIYPDSWFYDDCDFKNIPIFADTSLILEHDSRIWNRNLEYKKT